MVSTVSSGLVGAAFRTKASEPSLGRPINYRGGGDPRNQRPNIDDRYSPRGGFGPYIVRQTGAKKSVPKLFCEGRRIAGGSDCPGVIRAAKPPPRERWEVGRVIFPPVVATRQSSDSASSVVNFRPQDAKREDRQMNVRGTSLSLQPNLQTPRAISNASRRRNKKAVTTKGSPVPVLGPLAKRSLDSAVRRQTSKETGHG